MKENSCLFCKIIAKELPSHIIYEDTHILAFLDTNPVNPGHTLVLPKNHSSNILEIDDRELGFLALSIKKISLSVKKATEANGINIHINNESSAGQKVFHTHIHVIPRFENDGLKMWEGSSYTEEESKSMAEKIKKFL
jgi:histidine triad (HIT) family protein